MQKGKDRKGGVLQHTTRCDVLRPTHFPCRCTYHRHHPIRTLYPTTRHDTTQHNNRRRPTPPRAPLPPTPHPASPYLPLVRYPTRPPFAHLRVTMPASGNSRYKAIRRASRVDVIFRPLSPLLFRRSLFSRARGSARDGFRVDATCRDETTIFRDSACERPRIFQEFLG